MSALLQLLECFVTDIAMTSKVQWLTIVWFIATIDVYQYRLSKRGLIHIPYMIISVAIVTRFYESGKSGASEIRLSRKKAKVGKKRKENKTREIWNFIKSKKNFQIIILYLSMLTTLELLWLLWLFLLLVILLYSTN